MAEAEIVEAVELRARGAHVRLRGDLTIPAIDALDEVLRRLARRRLDTIELDFTGVARADASAVAVIELARRTGSARIELEHLNDRTRAVFDALATELPVRPARAPRPPLLERLGGRILGIGRGLRALGALIANTTRVSGAAALRRTHLPTASVGEQIAAMGTSALGIVGLLGFLLGVSIAFQGAIQLRRLGATEYVGDLVGLSMVRELAPLITAIIVTGRSGAAIAAELGAMRADAEIDALATMGISPVRYLVVPRMVALTVVMPVLTLFSMLLGLLGGMVVAEIVLRMSPLGYWWRLAERLELGDFARGLIKSVAFAWIVGISGAHLGLRARRDPGGVGVATTRAVVTAVFWIVVFDAAFESIAAVVRT
ncbi:MAG TPA: ABC transporter permease [Kofleriaceae bacterium]|nr:ABC transporter permease [Kofleriaceae bacterium]